MGGIESIDTTDPVKNQKAPQQVHSVDLRQFSLDVASSIMNGVSHAIRLLPESVRYLPADALTLPLILLRRNRQHMIEQNYATMLRLPATDPQIRALARGSVRNFGRMAIDFLRVRTMTFEEVRQWAVPVNGEYLLEAIADHRGVILALPHVGSWDVAAVLAQAYGVNLTVVTESNWVTELVASSRKNQGVTLAPRDRSLRLLFRTLARNEAVVMLSDLANPGVQTIDVPFFGKPSPFPTGPARLAQHTKTPIVVVASVRMPDNTYHIECRPPLRVDPQQPVEAAIATLTAAVASGFEQIISRYPDQWYPFHPIWPAPSAESVVAGNTASTGDDALNWQQRV